MPATGAAEVRMGELQQREEEEYKNQVYGQKESA
jgi:hypothetical protein